MPEIQPNCLKCKEGCCEEDIKLYGFMKIDLVNLAQFNQVTTYPPGSFTDLDTMYSHLKATQAADGYYALRNDEVAPDIDGIRIGGCNACVDGLCLLEKSKPRPCSVMELAGRMCKVIFMRRIGKD